jgi:hypothetical protein
VQDQISKLEEKLLAVSRHQLDFETLITSQIESIDQRIDKLEENEFPTSSNIETESNETLVTLKEENKRISKTSLTS